MGILTTSESAKAFSCYVTVFGIALLVSSAIYLRDLDKWAEKYECVPDTPIATDNSTVEEIILCAQLKIWRGAAITGIVIGAIDFLLVPFLICCIICIVCGCSMCNCMSLEDDISNIPETRSEVTEMIRPRETTTTSESLEKYDLSKLPSTTQKYLNILGWIIWVLAPFFGTAFITIGLCKTEAIRVGDDTLYDSAIALFVIAFLNLMVYLHKVMSSVYRSQNILVTTTKPRAIAQPIEETPLNENAAID